MAEEPDSIVLRHLRRIDGNMTELREDMREVKRRLSLIEEGQAILSRRPDRIERRLDLVESDT
jgi:hypothetical protein